MPKAETNSVEIAIMAYREGRMVIIVDDEDRENEGDFAMAADAVTPEAINFMASVGRGLICCPMEGDRLDQLDLPPMVQRNTARLGTAFTVSVDASESITTGISAFDRARTIQVLINEESTPNDLARPGHIFPLRYAEGGVLVRAGQTEASVDLAKLAGRYPASVICEVMGEDGRMARRPELEKISEEHDIPIVSVADIIQFRFQHENLIERVAEARLPTPHGVFKVIAYRSGVDPAEHLALVLGKIDPEKPVLVRVHSECLTGDVFGSLRCDCGDQAEYAMKMIGDSGNGIFLYMRQEGRGIGLVNKLKAYALQDEGLDTVEANEKLGFPMDLRHYGVGAQILVDLGVGKFKLLTNNPRKMVGLEGYGLKIVDQIPIEMEPNAENERYLRTKKNRMGHLLDIPEPQSAPESSPESVPLD
ncbi:MAG: bifunctional 3,4-dihydroxy-2-butanone-4-phosphate synthase/GTP cyclohydrolase II [Chloroflexi bacterium]|nr:bifunctional 3,4-dihydroxy-2-butanone-4-phosphate synthase/GTP cyclohydrolase II [Chloroflexota bacterium]